MELTISVFFLQMFWKHLAWFIPPDPEVDAPEEQKPEKKETITYESASDESIGSSGRLDDFPSSSLSPRRTDG